MNSTPQLSPIANQVADPARTTWWRSIVERHALLAFFGLTFALSWSLWGIQSLLAADPISARWLGIIAAYGPTLAAIALAGLLRPEREPAAWPSRQRWLAGAVLAGTVGLNSIVASNPFSSTHPLAASLLWLVITLLPAWVVWNSFSRRLGVRTLLQTLTTWRVSPIWYLVALLLPVIISAAGIALLALLGQPLPSFPRTEPLPTLLPLLVTTFFATLLYGGPLGEEVGWRGFALPRLQERFSPLVASLLLSVVWGLWHTPLHLQGVYHGIFPDGLPGILLRIVTTIPTTILFTWLFNRTRGNLWLAVVLHTAVNNTAGFWLPLTIGVYAAMILMMVTLIITDRMWRVQRGGLRRWRAANTGCVLYFAKKGGPMKQWLYRGGHPNWVARLLNRCSAVVYALGVAPNYLVTLEVAGRRSGRPIRLPLVMAVVAGERYLVSMLGAGIGWVQNVQAAGGNVILHHGQHEAVHLEAVAVDQRAPILKAYLQRAPGARAHVPIDKDAPLAAFAQVALKIPVFRVVH